MFNRSALPQDRFGNRGHLIQLRVGGIDDGEFHSPRIFGIILGVTAAQSHVAFHRKKIGEQAAGEHDDKAGVGEMNAQFAPGPMKTFGVCRDQIDEQDRRRSNDRREKSES